VDVSNTAGLSDIQWAFICGQIDIFISEDMKPFIGDCSQKMKTMFEIADRECPKKTETFIDKDGKMGSKKTVDALCHQIRLAEKALDLAGIDISDPSKFEKYQWGIVCGQLLLFESQKSTVATCSPTMAKLAQASTGKCPKEQFVANADNFRRT
jgi:hypothetical protein